MDSCKPKLGRIEFLNVLPVYHALEAGIIPHAYELAYGKPAFLNAAIQKAELAVSAVSSIEYARHPDSYRIVPDLSIASEGEVMSVLLLSRSPIKQLKDKNILLSNASHTSVALLKILLAENFHIPATYAHGSASSLLNEGKYPEAMLVIGDEALRLREHPLFPYKMDMGEAWQSWTGLPFVFGLWVVRKDFQPHVQAVEDPAALLHASRNWGNANREQLIALAEEISGFSQQDIGNYYHCLKYTLGENEIKGLGLFYQKLATHGELAATPELFFWQS